MLTRPPPIRPPTAPARTAADRVILGTDARQENRRSLAIGIVATIIVHLLLVSLPHSLFRLEVTPTPPASQDLDLELTEPEEPPEPEERPRYVETNPDAPENEPDETANISDRNQQATNETLPDALSPNHTPAREGEEIASNKIVSGDLTPPVPATPATPEGNPAPEVEPSIPTAQNPLAGFEEDRGDEKESLGTSKAPPTEKPTAVQEHVEGTETDTKDARPMVRATPGAPERPQPAPRPRVVRTPPGPVQRQNLGVLQTGYVGVNARFSQFGEYMARMVEAVSQRWTALCSSRGYGENSTYVVLRFQLNRDGNIADLGTMDTNALAIGVLLCRTALEQGQSYGAWTEEMVKTLGEDDTVVFTFHYR